MELQIKRTFLIQLSLIKIKAMEIKDHILQEENVIINKNKK